MSGNSNGKGNRRDRKRRWQAIVALVVLVAMIVVMIVSSILVQAAGPVSIDSSGLAVGQTSVFYDASIGMPTSEANAIAQTSDGFIWIGSYSGLVRYDGTTFYRYDSSLGISSVISLYVDSQDRLWIGTNDNGIVLMEGQEYTYFGKDDGLRALSIKSITEDANGNIMIATTQGMSYLDKDLVMHHLDDPKVDDEYICELRSGSDGTVYGETLDGDFFYIEDLKVGGYYNGEELGIGAVNCICPDPAHDGWVYLGTEKSDVIHANIRGGMKEYDIKTYNQQTYINMVYFVGDRMWICSDDGIGHVDSNGLYYKLQNMSVNNSVDTMMEDMEGNLWFASSRQGIMKIAYSIFTDINRLAALEPRVCNTTIKYKGDLYVGTDTGLVILKGEERPVNNELTKMLDGIRIRSMKEDSKGNLWICTYSEYGLMCVHPDGTYDNYNEENGFSSTRVRTVTELKDGRIMVSTSGGVYYISGDEAVPAVDFSKIGNTEILTICEGDNGQIYLGSDGDGLYVLDGEEIRRYGLEEGLKSEVILRVKKDTEREGYYWIITSNSISYMYDGKITTIEQFPYSNNFDMFFAKNGDIWVLSSGGIYRVHGDALIANKSIDYSIYDEQSGLPYVTTANSRNYIDDNGNLYISGTTGISKVNIDESDTGSASAMLTMPYVEVDGKIIEIGSDNTVRIPASAKRITIYGYALTYTLNNPRVSYYLEGFDNEPMYTTKRDLEPVTYTNLDGGRYVYHLATIDTSTKEIVNQYDVTIIKNKALHEMWWFRILVLVVIGVIIALIVFRYIKDKTARLEKEKAEKQQLVDETIYVFAQCIDMKDNYTRGHSFRVSKYTGLLAEKMGYSADEVHEMRNIALLHDIGKISIPDAILNKQSGLTDEEYAIMKSHASNGYDVLKYVSIMPNLADGAGYHHERLDGKGYPYGKQGDEIPMVAQIIAVADTFDAMYSTRPYRKKMPLMDVISEIERVAGTQLNADVVKCLVELAKEGMLEDETAV